MMFANFSAFCIITSCQYFHATSTYFNCVWGAPIPFSCADIIFSCPLIEFSSSQVLSSKVLSIRDTHQRFRRECGLVRSAAEGALPIQMQGAEMPTARTRRKRHTDARNYTQRCSFSIRRSGQLGDCFGTYYTHGCPGRL